MRKFSALKIYKTLLDIVWFAMIIVLFGFMMQNIFSLIANQELILIKIFNFPIRVELAQIDFSKYKNSYIFENEEPATAFLEISKVKIASLGNSFIIIYLIAALTAFCLMMYQLKLLRDFLRDIMARNIFTVTNVKRLKLIAVVELITISLGLCFYLLFSYIVAQQPVFDRALSYAPDYWALFESLPITLEYLIFAGVFSFGLKLKQEQDLTI